MELTPEQITRFHESGYLTFPSLFSREEIARIQQAAVRSVQNAGPNVTPEFNTESVRMVHGSHELEPAINKLCRHPRVIRPAEQLVNSGVYIHQSRLNYNAGLGSGGFEWHQDYATRKKVDGLPEPRALMIAVFLDDVTAAQGPLLFIPGSHRDGVIDDFVPVRDATGNVLMRLAEHRLIDLVERGGGVEAGVGPAGTVIFMHCNLVHGSTPNITPLRRALFYINVNSVENRQTTFTRAEFHAGTDFSAIVPVEDDALVQ